MDIKFKITWGFLIWTLIAGVGIYFTFVHSILAGILGCAIYLILTIGWHILNSIFGGRGFFNP